MRDRATLPEPTLRLPFRLRGYEGEVSVFYEPNADPVRWGYSYLNLPFDIGLAAGFPVCRATVSYNGEGYHAAMGWIQVITVVNLAGHTRTSVDVAPMHWETDTPFAQYGYLPELFDAPGPNPPRSDETWVAESFLAIAPDVARSRRVRSVLGFRWGYELSAGRARPLPPTPASEDDWRRCRDVLRERYPNWEFSPNFHVE